MICLAPISKYMTAFQEQRLYNHLSTLIKISMPQKIQFHTLFTINYIQYHCHSKGSINTANTKVYMSAKKCLNVLVEKLTCMYSLKNTNFLH